MGGGNAQKTAMAKKKAPEKAGKAGAGSQLESNAKAMSTIVSDICKLENAVAFRASNVVDASFPPCSAPYAGRPSCPRRRRPC